MKIRGLISLPGNTAESFVLTYAFHLSGIDKIVVHTQIRWHNEAFHQGLHCLHKGFTNNQTKIIHNASNIDNGFIHLMVL